MPQSLSAVYVHLVFSTKNRVPFLRDLDIRQATFAYLSGTSKKLDCPTITIGGMPDHVHVLARLGRTISQADWVKEVKRVTNGWLKKPRHQLLEFEWQSGYAAFSVSQSNLARVRKYISEQETHHSKFGFQDELRTLLRKHQIDFDEKYVWD
jgi:REP element-mobilizing transposase RayT